MPLVEMCLGLRNFLLSFLSLMLRYFLIIPHKMTDVLRISLLLIAFAFECDAADASVNMYACGDKPADIIFVLDSSSSIKHEDFRDQLNFVNDVIGMFDVSPTQTQFGSVSFSNWVFVDFHLNEFSEKSGIRNAVNKIQQTKGDTNTAGALSYMNDVMFTERNGARSDIPHIVIVLTDGKSNHPHETAVQAARARAMGTHMFAIGVGKEVSKGELKTIASFPHRDHVYMVDDFSVLQGIKNKLAIKTCEATDPAVPRLSVADMVVDQACGDAAMADVVFALAPGANPDNTERGLAFFRDVSLGFDVNDGGVHVGLVPKDCHEVPEINVAKYYDKDSAISALEKLIQNANSTASVLRYMRKNSFSSKDGARPKAKKIAVVVLDDKTSDLEEAIEEANKLKSQVGTELFIIGVGKHITSGELNALATEPPEQHVFHVSDYNDLQRITFLVKNALCPVPALR